MQIHKCIASKPGLLENKILTFNDKITLIYGENDSGKSLIAKAMIDTLWGELSNRLLLNGSVWGDLYLEIFFSISSNHFSFIKEKTNSFSVKLINNEIEKEIVKADLKEARSNINRSLLLKLNDSLGNGKSIDIFNNVDIETFTNISFLPSPHELLKNANFNYKAFRCFILEDKNNFYSIYDDINKSFNAEELDNSYNNLVLDEILKLESEIKNIGKKIQIIDVQNSRIVRLYKEVKRVIDETERLSSDLSDIRNRKIILLNLQKNLKKIEEIDTLIQIKGNEIKEEQEKIQAVTKLIRDINKQYPQFKKFNEKNRKNLKRIQESYRELKEVHEEIEKFHFTKRIKKKRLKWKISFTVIALVLFFLAFGFLDFENNSILNTYKSYLINGVLILTFFASLTFSISYFLTSRSKFLKHLLNKRTDIKEDLSLILKENNLNLNEESLGTTYEFLIKYFEEYGEYSIKQSELFNMKEDLKEKGFIQAAKDELTQMRKDRKSYEDEIDKDLFSLGNMKNFQLDFDNINRMIIDINRGIRPIKEKIKQNESILLNMTEEIKLNKNDENERSHLIEEKRRSEKDLQNLHTYKNTISFIIDTMKEAANRKEDQRLNELAQSSLEVFQHLTNGQYNKIANLKFIKELITGNQFEDDLNPSIIYLLFLSIKIASTSLFVDSDVSLPLIIDEPFVYLDDVRVSRLKEILDEISEKRQIIIFTHNKNHNDWHSIINL